MSEALKDKVAVVTGAAAGIGLANGTGRGTTISVWSLE